MNDHGRAAARVFRIASATSILVLLAGSAFASIPTPPPPTPTPPPAVCVAPFPSPGDVCCFLCATTHTCVTALGGSGCFDVAAPAACCWSARVLSGPGLTLTAGAEDCGNGRVCYEVAPYLGDIGRIFEVQVGDEVYRIGQSRPGTVTPTRTPSVTPTPPVTDTPTCAPTGTPYCAAECTPCPESRPGCPAVPCGRCFENPRCEANQVCVPPGAFPGGGCCSCATVTPTVSPCVEYEEERLEFDFSIAPSAPRVGDDVTLTFHVRNTTSGLAGIPAYGVFITAPLFSGTPTPHTTGVTSLGTETVTFDVHAALAGTASVALSVNYETGRGCIGEMPVFFFRTASSPEYPVTVGPAACTGDCDRDSRVTIDELLTMVNIGLGAAVIDACTAGDANGDGEIRIEDLMLAVAHALSGCDV